MNRSAIFSMYMKKFRRHYRGYEDMELLGDMVYVGENGDFTVAVITTADNVSGCGAAKRSVEDEYNPEIGERIAVSRAIDQLFAKRDVCTHWGITLF